MRCFSFSAGKSHTGYKKTSPYYSQYRHSFTCGICAMIDISPRFMARSSMSLVLNLLRETHFFRVLSRVFHISYYTLLSGKQQISLP